jgi:Mg2+-importing ATPase
VPAIAISTDRVDPERILSAQRWRIQDIQKFMIVFGLISTGFDIITFGVLLTFFHADEATFQTAWFVESLLTELAVLLVLRTQGPALKSMPSALLLWATVGIAAVALGLPYVAPVASIFTFVPLPIDVVVAMLAIVAGYVLATEFAKVRFFRYATRKLQP